MVQKSCIKFLCIEIVLLKLLVQTVSADSTTFQNLDASRGRFCPIEKLVFPGHDADDQVDLENNVGIFHTEFLSDPVYRHNATADFVTVDGVRTPRDEALSSIKWPETGKTSSDSGDVRNDIASTTAKQIIFYHEFTGADGFKKSKILKFSRQQCWVLTEIEDHSLTENGNVRSDWLERAFNRFEDCYPYRWYYDIETKKTNNGILEHLGYSAIDHGKYAEFYVDEPFYGYRAKKITLPGEAWLGYMVIIDAPMAALKKSIEAKTHDEIPAYPSKPEVPDSPVAPGYAYLQEIDKNTTAFTCSSPAPDL